MIEFIGDFVRLLELSKILSLVHIGDGDDLGVTAKQLHELLTKYGVDMG